MADTVMSWLSCLLPRVLCRWLWDNDIPLGAWAPHILGRVLGANAVRVDGKAGR